MEYSHHEVVERASKAMLDMKGDDLAELLNKEFGMDLTYQHRGHDVDVFSDNKETVRDVFNKFGLSIGFPDAEKIYTDDGDIGTNIKALVELTSGFLNSVDCEGDPDLQKALEGNAWDAVNYTLGKWI